MRRALTPSERSQLWAQLNAGEQALLVKYVETLMWRMMNSQALLIEEAMAEMQVQALLARLMREREAKK